MERTILEAKLAPRFKGLTPGVTQSLKEIGIKQIPDGWLKIVGDLDEKLSKIDPNYTIFEIPGEEWGRLNFPMFNSSTEAWEACTPILSEAIDLSANTCHICGDPGDLYDFPVDPAHASHEDESYGEALCLKHFGEKK